MPQELWHLLSQVGVSRSLDLDPAYCHFGALTMGRESVREKKRQALTLRAMVPRNQTVLPELFAGPGAFARPRQSRNAKRKPKRGWPRSPYTQPTSYSNSRPSKEVEAACCGEACAAAFLGEFGAIAWTLAPIFLILIGTSFKLHTCFLARKSLFQAWMLVAELACHLHCSPFLWLVLRKATSKTGSRAFPWNMKLTKFCANFRQC